MSDGERPDTRGVPPGYVADVEATGALRSPAWAAALRAVPRHLFVPRFFLPTGDGRWQRVDADDPDWGGWVYQDQPLTTQLDGDDTAWQRAASGAVAGAGTCSSTQPSLMARMLDALSTDGGERVLEIGTGTGYHTALLSHHLGDAAVTSVEIDPVLGARAAAALQRAGYHPALAIGDGTHGWATGAPYDRIIATCSVPRIPPAWIQQTRPGALILAGLHRDLGSGPLIGLTTDGHGGATGRFLPIQADLTPSRTSRTINPRKLLHAALRRHTVEPPRQAVVDAYAFTHPDAAFFAALRLPRVAWIGFAAVTGPAQVWLLASDGCAAACDIAAGTVTQHGPRRLWDELESAYAIWESHGRPTRDRIGLTVHADRTHAYWLDEVQQLLWTTC